MSQDLQTTFCTAQAVFGNGTTVSSTDWVDMKVAQDNAGGGDIEVEIIVTTSFVGGTSGEFQLCAVDAAGANPVVLDTSRAIAIASLIAPGASAAIGGTRIVLRMDPKQALPAANLTALRVQCVNVGNNSAGSISAALVPQAGTMFPGKAYPTGY